MDILKEAAMSAIEEDDIINSSAVAENIEESQGDSPTGRLTDLIPDLSFLLAPTGSGSVESYLEHPMNFKQSKGMAQILRGCTGILGELNYAIVDIALGTFQFMKEGKGNEQAINPEQ